MVTSAAVAEMISKGFKGVFCGPLGRTRTHTRTMNAVMLDVQVLSIFTKKPHGAHCTPHEALPTE